MPSSAIACNLANALPDIPRWIDPRGMLLSGRATVSGGTTVDAGFVVRVSSGGLSVVAVVGRPPPGAIAEAVEDITDMTPVICQLDNAIHVGQALATRPRSSSGEEWTPERVIAHRLTSLSTSESPDDVAIRLLRRDDPLEHLPPGLRFEITHARELAPVAVALADERPVTFCYPCWITETLWDVSIDTMERYRRRGLAARVAGFMIARMRAEGREPVWAALESNAASLKLAGKLGFTRTDEFVVFSRGPWAYFTRGFDEPGVTS